MTTPGQQPPGARAGPDPRERLKLALAVTGLVFVTLFGWLVYSLLFAFLDVLYTLWGLLLLLGLIVSAVAFVVALAFSFSRRRPPRTSGTDAATYESVETRQM